MGLSHTFYLLHAEALLGHYLGLRKEKCMNFAHSRPTSNMPSSWKWSWVNRLTNDNSIQWFSLREGDPEGRLWATFHWGLNCPYLCPYFNAQYLKEQNERHNLVYKYPLQFNCSPFFVGSTSTLWRVTDFHLNSSFLGVSIFLPLVKLLFWPSNSFVY